MRKILNRLKMGKHLSNPPPIPSHVPLPAVPCQLKGSSPQRRRCPLGCPPPSPPPCSFWGALCPSSSLTAAQNSPPCGAPHTLPMLPSSLSSAI